MDTSNEETHDPGISSYAQYEWVGGAWEQRMREGKLSRGCTSWVSNHLKVLLA